MGKTNTSTSGENRDFSRSEQKHNRQKKRDGKKRYKDREFQELIRRYKYNEN